VPKLPIFLQNFRDVPKKGKMKMIIRVNLRNIPEIKEAFDARPNKKDSFNRWFHRLNNGGGWFEFHVDDKNMNPVER
jgi:hypothetical protein